MSSAGSTYDSPTSFSIGSGWAPIPLVSVAQLKGHLSLLEAFSELKIRVESASTESEWLPDALATSNKERRWAWFVGIAVQRFEKWCRSVGTMADTTRSKEYFLNVFLPPLDVMMVWHSYMLNPAWYAEDISRMPFLSVLYDLGDLFMESLVYPGFIGSAFHSTVISGKRMRTWFKLTSTSFDPFECLSTLTSKEVRCVECRESYDHPFVNLEGTGYLQHDFVFECNACQRKMGKESLGLYKLVRTLNRTSETPYSFLAGTYHTPLRARNGTHARAMKRKFMESLSVHEIISSNLTMADVGRMVMAKIPPESHQIVRRIMSAYADDHLFSLDLVGAVLRQGGFVKKMCDLKWTRPTFFDDPKDAVTLQHAVARYHAFLDLIATTKGSYVPTLDIDLAWHTHQLTGRKYARDCSMYMHRFIDHDDKVEEHKLATSFDSTSRDWKTRFGVPYTHCGCSLPGDTIGDKLARVVKAHQASAVERGLIVSPSPSTIPADLLTATHPSDHNAVYESHERTTADSHRRARQISRLEQDEGGKTKLMVDNGKGKQKEREIQVVHDQAFLLPIPYHAEQHGCVAMLANVVGDGNYASYHSSFHAAALPSASVCASGCSPVYDDVVPGTNISANQAVVFGSGYNTTSGDAGGSSGGGGRSS